VQCRDKTLRLPKSASDARFTRSLVITDSRPFWPFM